jgi:hypothetical protein
MFFAFAPLWSACLRACRPLGFKNKKGIARVVLWMMYPDAVHAPGNSDTHRWLVERLGASQEIRAVLGSFASLKMTPKAKNNGNYPRLAKNGRTWGTHRRA